MAKAGGVDEIVKRVAQLRAGPPSAELRAELAKHLGGKANLVVAKAAEVAAALQLADLSADMEQAFRRFMDDLEDKGCVAKTAIAKSLNGMGAGTEGLLLRGVRHVQMEGAWGGSVDVAGELRSTCGLALAAIGSREALTELADLLMDPLPGCRVAAARGIGHVGHESGLLPLRVKVLAGDEEIEVLEECLAAMVKLAPRKSVPFLARLLDADEDDLRTAAAIALGLTRDPTGLHILLERWERDIDPASRLRLLPAIALSRLPEAVSFLVGTVETGHRTVAVEAIKSLAPYRHDGQVRARVAAAVAARDEADVRAQFDATFGHE